MCSESKMSEVRESQLLIAQHIFGTVNSLVLKCAVKLGIVDAIHCHATPITLSELGAFLSVPPANLPVLYRIMRYLVHLKIVTLVNNKRLQHVDNQVEYALAPAAKLLLKGEQSLAPIVKFLLDEGYLSAVHSMDLCLYGDVNTPAYDQVEGESMWARASRDHAFNKLLNEGMSSRGTMAINGIVKVCREAFMGIKTLVDVGGGTGKAAQAIVGAYPHVQCTVLDMPHVVEGLLGSAGVEYVGGDMFSFVPRGDAVLLMSVLHDWNDDDCLKILKQCKEAILREGGKLLILEQVIMDRAVEDEFYNTVLALDVFMMAAHGGKERTEREWKELLITKAGFSGYRVTPIWPMQHIIEAHL